MILKRIPFCGLILPLLLPLITSAQVQQDMDWLDWGYTAEMRGEYDRALEIWREGRSRMDQPDSRLGLAFIRLATEQRLSEWYSEATDMYLWAISHPYVGGNRGVISRELDRLKPIVGESIYRQWHRWLEASHEQLPTDVRGFWIQSDPTPDDPMNERLIEHWIRIAEARRHFARNRLSPLQTDDRGLLYVRYGRPDRRVSGVLTLDGQRTVRWFEHQIAGTGLWLQTEGSGSEGSAGSVGSEGSVEGGPHRTEAASAFRANDLNSWIEAYVRPYHRGPEYEVWIYDEPGEADGPSPLIVLFGTDIHTGRFRQIESVGEFVPLQAYQGDRNRASGQPGLVRRGVSPALLLQMIYYEQLSGIHPWFSDQLIALQRTWLEQGKEIFKAPDLAHRTAAREALKIQSGRLPRQISTEEGRLPRVPLQVHQYRLLDEALEPVIVTFLESRPGQALRQEPEAQAADYTLQHAFLDYNQRWQVRAHEVHHPQTDEMTGRPDQVVQSVFITPHTGENFQAGSVQLLSTESDVPGLSELFPANLRGLGTVRNRQPEPLVSQPGELELADLILGYQDELPEDYPFTFRVANDQTIAADESLILHFEVYNLEPVPSSGFTRFELTYRIYPVLESGSLQTGDEAFYLTIRFEDDRTRLVEDLEIQTASLSSGLYELQVTIQDLVSRQQKRRSIRFEVTE